MKIEYSPVKLEDILVKFSPPDFIITEASRNCFEELIRDCAIFLWADWKHNQSRIKLEEDPKIYPNYGSSSRDLVALLGFKNKLIDFRQRLEHPNIDAKLTLAGARLDGKKDRHWEAIQIAKVLEDRLRDLEPVLEGFESDGISGNKAIRLKSLDRRDPEIIGQCLPGLAWFWTEQLGNEVKPGKYLNGETDVPSDLGPFPQFCAVIFDLLGKQFKPRSLKYAVEKFVARQNDLQIANN